MNAADDVRARLDEIRNHLDVLRWQNAEWIPDTEAARRLGSTKGSLATWRVTGTPALRYAKVGRTPMYYAPDITALLRSRGQRSTSEQPGAAVPVEGVRG